MKVPSPLLRQSEFAGAAAKPGGYPPLTYPEIAFAGRSNVGKSSLINRLLDRKIARTSSTPGRTQQLEQARIGEAKDLPSVQVLDYATPAERASKPRLLQSVMIAAVVSLLVGVFLALLVEYGRTLRHEVAAA